LLYHILYPLKELFFPFNVLKYITFRAAASSLTSLFITLIFTPFLIKKLKKMKIKENVYELNPPEHKLKKDTPTMGGILIVFSILISTLLWQRWDNRFTWIMVIALVFLFVIGFIDDILKLKGKRGLSILEKLIGQIILGVGIGIYLYMFPLVKEYPHSIGIPFLKNVFIHLGIFYILFVMLVVVASSNAVNLTDGLDGLATGVLIFVTLSYTVMAYIAGNVKFSSYLLVPYVKGVGEITIILAALIGSCLGFLWYNSYPAEVFMGDTGSLPLGGLIGLSSILVKQEIVLLIVGGVFVIEALSVIIQVFSFKKFGKRVFKMAPLHHHFEMLGWKEPKVVVRFWIITIILALFALMTLKLR